MEIRFAIGCVITASFGFGKMKFFIIFHKVTLVGSQPNLFAHSRVLCCSIKWVFRCTSYLNVNTNTLRKQFVLGFVTTEFFTVSMLMKWYWRCRTTEFLTVLTCHEFYTVWVPAHQSSWCNVVSWVRFYKIVPGIVRRSEIASSENLGLFVSPEWSPLSGFFGIGSCVANVLVFGTNGLLMKSIRIVLVRNAFWCCQCTRFRYKWSLSNNVFCGQCACLASLAEVQKKNVPLDER